MPPKLPLSAYKSIGEVAALLDLPQHMMKFWEARFEELQPLRRGRGDRARRLYSPEDIALLEGIRFMLRDEGYSIRGVQRAFREGGVEAVLGRAAQPRPALVSAA